MAGENNLAILLKTMHPYHQEGDYVFCFTEDPHLVKREELVAMIKEPEGFTVVMEMEVANKLGLSYAFIAAWITLTVHSALDAVGLTAAFSTALGKEGISCNVIAGFHHDHIFVAKDDAGKAMEILNRFSL